MANGEHPQAEALIEAIKDVLFGFGLFVTGGFALVWIIRTPRGFGASSSAIGFDTLPIICSTLLMGLAAIYLAGRLGALIAAMREAGRALPPASWPHPVAWRQLATVVVLVAYVLALRLLPFYAATFLLLAVMFVIYGQRNPVVVLSVAFAGSAALTGLFVYALRLPI